MNRILRKQYIVNKGFQARLTMIIILLVVIVANMVGGIVYFMLRTETGLSGLVSLLKVSSTDALLFPAIIIAQLISIFIVAFISMFVSHRMAGPVYRFERVIESMRDGELDFTFSLREKDEFKGLAESIGALISDYNQVLGSAKGSFDRMDSHIDELEALIEKKDKKKIMSKIAQIKEAGDKTRSFLEFFKTDLKRQN